MKAWIVWVFGISVGIAGGGPDQEAGPPYPLSVSLGGPESIYTPLLLKLAQEWPPKHLENSPAPPSRVKVRCFSTPGREFHIGIEQRMDIEAPLDRVESVVADVDRYKEIFTEFPDIHVLSRDRNRLATFWEHSIPFPFIPNSKYQMNYVIDRGQPARRIFRYQLAAKTNDMNTADGVIVLEALEKGRTRYTEYDFWDSEYGIAKTLAPKRIWKDSVEETLLSDLGFKFRSEHPEWTAEQVVKEAKKQIDEKEIERCVAEKKVFYLLSEASPEGQTPEVGVAPIR